MVKPPHGCVDLSVTGQRRRVEEETKWGCAAKVRGRLTPADRCDEGCSGRRTGRRGRRGSLLLVDVGALNGRTIHAPGKGVGGVTNPFRRGLSDDLLDDLMDGPCATVFRACVKAGLDVRLRANAVNLYFGGRSMPRIVGRSRLPHRLEIHFILRGIPAYIRSDDGPYFVAKVVCRWIAAVGARTAARVIGRRLRRRSSCQAGRPAPLDLAGHRAWPNSRQCTNIRTEPVAGGRIGAGSATLKVVELASRFDEARWLIEARGFKL